MNFMLGIREGNLAFEVDVMFFTVSGTASGTSRPPKCSADMNVYHITYTAGIDYEQTSTNFTLSLTGQVTAPVNLVDDSEVEATEDFFGNIAAVAGQDQQVLMNVDFDPILATATIIDDDSTCVLALP